jgi:predicted aspartyl protease
VSARTLEHGLAPTDRGLPIPMRRDARGRLLAPVEINGQGPFHLVVNTAASRCVVTEHVAQCLKLSVDEVASTLVHGVTADTRARAIRIESLSVGGKRIPVSTLPIVVHEGDGADGYLSVWVLTQECAMVEITHNELTLPAHRPRDNAGHAVSVRIKQLAGHLVAFESRIKGASVTTILDTGSDRTIGNLSLVRTLGGRSPGQHSPGAWRPLPPIKVSSLKMVGVCAFCDDLPLFEYLKLKATPAMLLAMDVLGRFDSLLVDYENQLIQFRPRIGDRAATWARAKPEYPGEEST